MAVGCSAGCCGSLCGERAGLCTPGAEAVRLQPTLPCEGARRLRLLGPARSAWAARLTSRHWAVRLKGARCLRARALARAAARAVRMGRRLLCSRSAVQCMGCVRRAGY